MLTQQSYEEADDEAGEGAVGVDVVGEVHHQRELREQHHEHQVPAQLAAGGKEVRGAANSF